MKTLASSEPKTAAQTLPCALQQTPFDWEHPEVCLRDTACKAFRVTGPGPGRWRGLGLREAQVPREVGGGMRSLASCLPPPKSKPRRPQTESLAKLEEAPSGGGSLAGHVLRSGA